LTRRERARELAGGRPLVSGDLTTVTWLTGLATDIEYGPSPFTVAPLVVLDSDGSLLAVVSEDEAGGVGEGVETRAFPGFAVEDVDRSALATRLAREALTCAREVAADVASLPGALVAALLGDGVEIVDVSSELRAARAVKDADEVAAIRASTSIADAGQKAAREAAAGGRTELDVWSEARAAMERAAGGRVPLLADLVSGERTAEVGGPPSDRVLHDGDLVLVDLVPRLDAYWSDSCATLSVGEALPEMRRAHDVTRAALERAVAMCRPGTRAADVDAAAREVVAEGGGTYPHHTGHGIGTSFHEEPRVIPDTARVLEEGMVVALEPGSYGDRWGVRVEQVLLVTNGEPEILSRHDLSL
jgi:Xaa-Pro dipeptidase